MPLEPWENQPFLLIIKIISIYTIILNLSRVIILLHALKSRATWRNRESDLGVQNEAGQRLTEICQENALITSNTFFQQHKKILHIDITKWSIPNSDCYILCSRRWRSSIQPS